jgi:probable HAF family extracellular repeat protein
MAGLGDLPTGDYLSQAFGVSADGKTVVGLSRTVNGFEAFRWSAISGMLGLGDLPGGTVSSCGTAITPDSSVIVGYGWAELGYEPWRWTSASGMVSLGELPGGAHFAVANATTPEGWVIVGQSSSTLSGNGGEAFRWEVGQPMFPLGDLPGGIFQSVALACSADGNIIVGQGSTDQGLEAMIWDSVNRMRKLQDALAFAITGSETGALDGWRLVNATGISADGTLICGHGVNPAGGTEAFLARLPRPCAANCDASNTVPMLNPADFQCFLNRFAAGDPYANCDNSRVPPVLNANDFDCFLTRIVQGCN